MFHINKLIICIYILNYSCQSEIDPFKFQMKIQTIPNCRLRQCLEVYYLIIFQIIAKNCNSNIDILSLFLANNRGFLKIVALGIM